ncbi:ion channel [Anaeromicropila herbilytica]|uniref:Potassium channel domain-containing protein n=1 Tax=Anaeromicropila herbilytica TaxID=2785025 RepID=A0A7R7IEF2_9FIRM|nr:potassium channel family protein [Anaeromicropila herbilytica]BCN32658.1 hypothetical protein bsdtb5_39530 [Anaeromicropila herbilytica]
MSSIIILLMTMGILAHVFQKIWKSKNYLLKYLSQVGGQKTKVLRLKQSFYVPFITIHCIIGIVIGYFIFKKDSDGEFAYRVFLSAIVALSFLLILLVVYFCLFVVIKEIICMKDTTINIILSYSIVSFAILFTQILTKNIDYPKGFIWISVVLYAVNLFGIGRVVMTIFKKKVLVKSIWSIALMNITFIIIALTNIAYEMQHVFKTPCYSRVLTSWGDAFYFVVISFFTVGYGDLYPVCETTKILSIVIILSGFTFTAVFVSAALSTTIEHFGSMEKK